MSVRGMRNKLAKLLDTALPQCSTRLVTEHAANEPPPPPCPRGTKCQCKRIMIVEVIVNTPEEARAALARNAEAP